MMLRKNNGQALVEFILILPVFLAMIFCTIDFSRVMMAKNNLENISSDIITYYQNGLKEEEIRSLIDENIDMKVNDAGKYVVLNLGEKIESLTPGLSNLTPSFFNIETKRYFIKDSKTIEDEDNNEELE